MNEIFKKLAAQLLDDDDGITEEAYYTLLEMGDALNLQDYCAALQQTVKAQDGRFFLPEE